MLSWLKPGQLIVCTETFVVPAEWGMVLPMKSIVYTIRQVTAPCDRCVQVPCLLLEEIRNEPSTECLHGCSLREEASFTSRAFKPVNTPSIVVLRSLLSPTPTDVRAKERVS